jgi:hypothetical protein
MKHSAGPWRVGPLDSNSQRIVESDYIEICSCWHHSVSSIEREMEANAQLIAAAPALLHALKHVVDMDGASDTAALWKQAREAIALAEHGYIS